VFMEYFNGMTLSNQYKCHPFIMHQLTDIVTSLQWNSNKSCRCYIHQLLHCIISGKLSSFTFFYFSANILPYAPTSVLMLTFVGGWKTSSK